MQDKIAMLEQLRQLKDAGLTFGDCISVFGVTDDDPYMEAARHAVIEGDLELDDKSVVSASTEGAYVLMWKWFSREDVGFAEPSEVIDNLITTAGLVLDGELGGLETEVAQYVELDGIIGTWMGWLDTHGGDWDDGVGSPEEQGDIRQLMRLREIAEEHLDVTLKYQLDGMGIRFNVQP